MKINKIYTIFTRRECPALALLLVLLAGCSAGGESSTLNRRVSLGNIRAQYYFDDNLPGPWQVFNLDANQAIFRVHEGGLEGAVVPNQGYIWSLNSERFNNVALQSTVQQTRGSIGNGFGLMCRADSDGNGYYFVISSAGQFAILKGVPGQINPVKLVDWQSSDAINPEFERNELLAICSGDYLSFSANGQVLAEVIDDAYYVGELGLVLGAVGQAVWVRYDDISLRDAVPLN